MSVETVAYPSAHEPSFEQRWAAWIAKGVEHDRRNSTWTLAVAVAIATSAVVAAGILLLR